MSPFDFQNLVVSAAPHSALASIFDEVYQTLTDRGFRQLTEGQKNVLVIESFFGESLNGGFYQYFSNESGRLAPIAPQALRQLGLTEYAFAIESFIELFPNGMVPESSDERQMQLDKISERHDDQFFEQLEKQFWDVYHADRGGYRKKLHDYILANEREFVFD